MNVFCSKCYKTFDSEIMTEVSDELYVCPDCLEKINKSEPREYTTDEVREKLIKHFWGILEYWEKESRTQDTRGKMEGFLHSMLATLDGCSIGVPGFQLIPCVDPSDKEFHIKFGENWYNDTEDIGGGLHEIMHHFKNEEDEN